MVPESIFSRSRMSLTSRTSRSLFLAAISTRVRACSGSFPATPPGARARARGGCPAPPRPVAVLGPGPPQGPGRLGELSRHAAGGQGERAMDRRERGPELVAHHGDEVVLHPLDPLPLVNIAHHPVEETLPRQGGDPPGQPAARPRPGPGARRGMAP